MKLLIHGYYGAGNAGDDALLQSMIDQISKRYPRCQITVSIRGKGSPAYRGPAKVEFVLGSDLTKLYQTISQSDVVIVGGGGLFQDYLGYEPLKIFSGAKGSINYYAAPIMLARILGVPSMLYAVGVGPFRTTEAENAVSWLASTCDVVTVRDHASARKLETLGVRNVILAADPAINLAEKADHTLKRNFQHHRNRPVVGLNLRSWFDQTQTGMRILQSAAEHLIQRYHARIVMLPFNRSPKELQLSRTLAKQLPPKAATVLAYNQSPAALKDLCGQLDIMVAMRLHASILAMGAGTPSLGISYDPKVAQFYDEMGLAQFSLGLDESGPDKIRPLLDLLMDSRKRVKVELGRQVARLQKLDVEKNIGSLVQLLKKPPGGAS